MNKDECIKLLKKYMDILKNEYGITILIYLLTQRRLIHSC